MTQEPTTPPTLEDVLLGITTGAYDGRLDAISSWVRDRVQTLGRMTVWEIKVGDRVRLNDKTRPIYLRGVEGTVLSKSNGKVRVQIADKDIARAGRYGPITRVPGTLLEVVA